MAAALKGKEVAKASLSACKAWSLKAVLLVWDSLEGEDAFLSPKSVEFLLTDILYLSLSDLSCFCTVSISLHADYEIPYVDLQSAVQRKKKKKKQGRSCCTLATNILDDTCLGSNEAGLTSLSNLTFLCRVISREKPKDGPEQGRTRLAKWHVIPSLPWRIKYLWLKLLSTVSGFQTVKVFFALYLLAKILTAGLLLESHSLNNENSAKNKDSGCWSCWIWPRWGDSDKETCI